MMKKKSSVITPPPSMDVGQGIEENLALNEEERKDALIKLIRKGAPSVPVKEKEIGEGDEDPRTKVTIRIKTSLVERLEIAAKERPLKTPVNTWITEAILAQLKKEGF